nr:TaqI-like C-terminal specificity domain-containing protein [Parapedobacter indicus]
MDFLKNTFYHPDFLVSIKDRADFVIHLDKTSQSPVGVLFEVKKPSNKAEMVTKENLNMRAMHELILYFLRDRINNKNLSLTTLVITNIYEWFVFDATQFEKIFNQNTNLQRAYKEWDRGQKVNATTGFFYDEIVKPFLKELNKEISFTYFNIHDYERVLKNESERDDRKLISLYKFFTPTHLLKLPFVNDSNTLDKGFFAELLHIIGLEETKEKSRKLIQRVAEPNRQDGSLLENTINLLRTEDALRKVEGLQQYGKTNEEQLFNVALSLCITWINRILFLKLLEAQLLKYHNGDKKYRFLNARTIPNNDELYKLFFQVLARQSSERSDSIQAKYGHIPYLNSSLFEISDLEKQTIRVNSLDDNLSVALYAHSVLKKRVNSARYEGISTLHYLLDFLDAYDFSSVGKEEIQEENKSIINAAVLGLVFEKINGYRDGSIYTPGAITTFLCKETIRSAVIKKFNDKYGWACETIADLSNYLSQRRNTKDILQYNELIEQVRVVDPAVGSGHFLVSSLNELIAIKAELGILADSQGKVLQDVAVSIANDELIVEYRQSKSFFEYAVHQTQEGERRVDPEVQRIQETIFNEKRKLIEGSLFGVDINPNSAKICRLRLWIELLKNAYYTYETGFSELETLPNIDINIKSGNSLLSKFSLSEDLSDVFKKQRFGVKDYQLAVASYKNTPNKDAKQGLLDFIAQIKQQFKETVSNRDPKRKKLSELRGKLTLAQNNYDLFGVKRSQKEMEKEVEKISKDIAKYEKLIADIENNAIYKSAFEWRFEFPEVLDENGYFEGFEVVIGNPPYIQLQKMGAEADVLQKGDYQTFIRTGDIYCLFYELAVRLLKPGYYFGYITSNKWMRADYGKALRKYFLEETNPLLLVDFGGYQVFASATVDTNMLIAQKAAYSGSMLTCLYDKRIGGLEKMSVFIEQSATMQKGFSDTSGWVILSPIEARIKEKIEAVGVPLKNWDIKIYRGILTGYNEAFIIDEDTKNKLIDASPKNAEIIRPILLGKNIKRYKFEWDNKWIIFTRKGIDISLYPAVEKYLFQYYEDLKPRNNGEIRGRKPGPYKWYEIQDNVAYFEEFEKLKIAWGNLALKSQFALIDEGYYINAPSPFIATNNLYLLAILNSQVADYYIKQLGVSRSGGYVEYKPMFVEQLPIPKISIDQQQAISSLVKRLISNTTDIEEIHALESEIEARICNFYGLSQNEIQVIS